MNNVKPSEEKVFCSVKKIHKRDLSQFFS